jgi:flagellar assembly protein FliH
MFLSKLITGQELSSVQIDHFDGNHLEDPSIAKDSTQGGGQIELPTGKWTALPPSRSELDADADEEEESPQDRMARLEKEAYEKGFEQGQKDGLDLERRQSEEKGKQFDALLCELHGLKSQLYLEAEGELLKLSMEIAKKVLREEVKLDSRTIVHTIREAMTFLVDKSLMQIVFHPDDMDEIKQLMPELTAKTKGGQLELVEDHAIERGGCILKTGFGRINATIDDQFGMLEKALEKAFKRHQEVGE